MGLGSFCYVNNNKIETIQPKNLRITGIQKGFMQYLEIYQSIQSDKDLDCVSYIFPTDNTLCIYSMKFQVGDETIIAKLQNKKAAKETFNEARRAGKTVAMTEETDPGITSIKIGNVPKDKIVSIIFECANTAVLQDPTTILTKIPLQASEPDGSLTDLYNVPSLEISVDLSISQLQPISNVYANCESNYEKLNDYNGKFTIKSAIFTDENILISTELSEPLKSQMVQSKKATVISVIPEFEAKKSDSKEFVFLIDCSASMLGESIRKAKESLHIFLTKLPEGSYFNIICFGTKFVKLFTKSSEKVQENVEKAKDFIDKIRANLGGTEMLEMLDSVFNDEVKIGGQRQIFIVTDGEVYESQKVIEKVKENNGFNRIFAIGLGHGADAGFLNEITELTNGKSDFVFNKSELPQKVNEHFELSLVDAATDVEIHIEKNDSFQTVPYPLQPLLPHVVSHIFVSSNLPIEDVMITGKLKDDDVENVISLHSNWTNDENEEGGEKKSPIFAFFAYKQLKKLSEDEEKSVLLSLESGVLSKFTSYVAVSENSYIEECDNASKEDDDDYCHTSYKKKGSKGKMKRCFAKSKKFKESKPLKSVHSYSEEEEEELNTCISSDEECESASKEEEVEHVTRRYKLKRVKCRSIRNRRSKGRLHMKKSSFVKDSSFSYEEDKYEKLSEEEHEDEGVLVEADLSKIWADSASFIDIIKLQSRDGFWDLPSSFVSNKLGNKSLEIRIDLEGSPIVKKRVISTVFTLGYLSKFYGEDSNKWKFAREKALKWLKRISSSEKWEDMISNNISLISK